MKYYFVSISILLFCAPVFAQTTFVPKVGDYVNYSLENSDSGTISRMTSSNEIKAIDSTAGTASVRQIFTQNGLVTLDQTNDQILTSLLYPTIIQIQKCSDQATATTSAVLETLKVHAGTFQTCHLRDLNPDVDGNINDLYFANVPFGFIKSVQTNVKSNASQVMELLNYKKL